jgi:hypothetical protein
MRLNLSSSGDYLEASTPVKKWIGPKNSNLWLGTVLKAVRRITKPTYPFNMNPTLGIDSGFGRFTVDEAQIIARQRQIKETVAKDFGESWVRVWAPTIVRPTRDGLRRILSSRCDCINRDIAFLGLSGTEPTLH